MDFPKRPYFSGMLITLALLFVRIHTVSAALSQTYCSSQNTGLDDGPHFHTWQSNGWCSTQCNQGNFAFAIVQDLNCWCSNYIPEDQQDVGNCDENCPGFPDERCGSKDNNLFGYVALAHQPSGTQKTEQPTSTTQPSSAPASPVSSVRETHHDPETVFQTVTEPGTAITPTPSKSPPSSATTTTLKTTTSRTTDQTTTTSDPPGNSVLIITKYGQPITTTIVYSPASTPTTTQTQKKGTNTGAIVGGTLGGVAALAAVIGGIFFLLWRRRRQQRDADGQSGVQRNVSTMSKNGLLRSEKVPQYPPQIATNIRRNSRMMQDTDSISPVSGSDRRSSRPYILDQRLNPSAIMTLDNHSRGSFVSLDDSRDYGRTLNVRNPDPNPDS